MSQDSLDAAAARHLERITGYLRASGLRQIPTDEADLRRELAAFMERRTPAILEPWLRDVGPALAIPENDWAGIKVGQNIIKP